MQQACDKYCTKLLMGGVLGVIYLSTQQQYQTIPLGNSNLYFWKLRHRIMSSFLNQAQQKAEEAGKK